MWRMKGNFLTNEHGKVLDIEGGKDWEGQQCIAWNKHGGLNQQFDIVYEDEWPDEPKKNELNEKFGMVVDRSFYIVSQLPGRRYLDMVGNDFVIKTRNGRTSQQWYFHQPSLTIRSRTNNQSWDIVSNGGSNNIRITSTNSKWWQLFKYEAEHFVNMWNKKALDVSGGKDVEGQKV